ncbi:MAG: hypothetical protein ABI091_21275, partial [Ferruginibacter sp.]
MLSLAYVYISRLDHFIYTLLATGSFSFGTIPNLLAAHIAFPVARHSGRWCFWFIKEYHHAARKDTESLKKQPGKDNLIQIFSKK